MSDHGPDGSDRSLLLELDQSPLRHPETGGQVSSPANDSESTHTEEDCHGAGVRGSSCADMCERVEKAMGLPTLGPLDLRKSSKKQPCRECGCENFGHCSPQSSDQQSLTVDEAWESLVKNCMDDLSQPIREVARALSEDKEKHLLRLLTVSAREKSEQLQADNDALRTKIDHLLSGDYDAEEVQKIAIQLRADNLTSPATKPVYSDNEAELMVKIQERKLQEKDEELSRLAKQFKQACDDRQELYETLSEQALKYDDAMSQVRTLRRTTERLQIENRELKDAAQTKREISRAHSDGAASMRDEGKRLQGRLGRKSWPGLTATEMAHTRNRYLDLPDIEWKAKESPIWNGIRTQVSVLYYDLPWRQIVQYLVSCHVLAVSTRSGDSFPYHYICQEGLAPNENCRRLMNVVLGMLSFGSFNAFLEGVWDVYPHDSPNRPPWVGRMEAGLCAACAVHIDEICEEDLEPEEMLLLLEKLGVSQAEGTATPGRSSPEDTGSRSPKSRLRRWSKQNPGPKAYATLLQASNDAGLLWMPQ